MAADGREVDAGWVLSYLDECASTTRTAEVEMVLGDGGLMMVRAGGPGTLCSPARPPFQAYEVHLNHGSSRFWSRYAAKGGMDVYSRVPKLLVTHHITRHGGITDYALATKPIATAEQPEKVSIVLELPKEAITPEVMSLIQRISAIWDRK